MTPTYAVLFKCHYWDPFIQRQLDRIRQRTTGDVFVLVDETLMPVRAVHHPDDRVLRITRAMAEEIGLDHSGETPVFWYSNDFPLHIFTRTHPHFDYFVMIEYDVVTNLDLDTLIARLQAAEVDFVGEPIRTPLHEWPWLASCDGWYETNEVLHWLSCLSIFSNRAAHFLYQRRTLAALRVRSGLARMVPNCEAVVATELNRAGYRLMALHELGSTACYDTSPPRPETMLPGLASEGFIHPVLDTPHFLGKLVDGMAVPIALLAYDHPYRRILGDAGKTEVLPLLHHRLYASRDDEGCRLVINRMRRWGSAGYLHRHGLDGTNLALGKPASQSSTSEWSLRPDEANGAVAGPVSGRYTFHTALEARPWWMVDLLTPQPVECIRVFNRMDLLAVRANGLEVYASRDGRLWELAGQHRGDVPFGGADGHPLEVMVRGTIRFVRVEMPRESVLHLDQVQVLSHDRAERTAQGASIMQSDKRA